MNIIDNYLQYLQEVSPKKFLKLVKQTPRDILKRDIFKGKGSLRKKKKSFKKALKNIEPR